MKCIRNKTKHDGRDKHYWLKLTDRYFEADTSDEEEQLLMRFLASDILLEFDFTPEEAERLNEARAVMGLALCGRDMLGSESKQTNRQTFLRPRVGWVAAASVVFLLGATWLLRLHRTDDDRPNVCTAYVDGVEVTDPSEVIDMMHESWDDVQVIATDELLSSQMSSMINDLD